MNIAFMKLGKSVKFKRKSFGASGGDNEASAFLKILANANPNITFWIIGRSDFEKLDTIEKAAIFPYGNVKNILNSRIAITTTSGDNFEQDLLLRRFEEENVKMDACISLVGCVSNTNFPNFWVKRDKTGFAKIMMAALYYSSHQIYWLNTSNCPLIEIVNDPRYTLSQPKDLMKTADICLSQFDYEYKSKSIKDMNSNEVIVKTTPTKYAYMETSFVFEKEKARHNNTKDKKFLIVLNEGYPSRYESLNEWVLSKTDDVEIYGAWSDERCKIDKRFKGSLHIDELENIVKRSKYTFIIPIKAGWVTAKYLEMIYSGCIPFFHPDYDSQEHIKVPDILRPKNIDEMLSAIEKFESDEEYRLKFVKDLQDSIITPDLYNGKKINSIIMQSVYDLLNLGKYEEPQQFKPKNVIKSFA